MAQTTIKTIGNTGSISQEGIPYQICDVRRIRLGNITTGEYADRVMIEINGSATIQCDISDGVTIDGVLFSGTPNELTEALGSVFFAANGTGDPVSLINRPYDIDFYNKKIYFFGASETSGIGASVPSNRFSSIVSRELNAIELNFGIGGSTMQKRTPLNPLGGTNMIDLLPSVPVKDNTMSMVILSFGSNDVFANMTEYSVENYKIDYRTSLQNIIGKGWKPSEILILGLPYVLPESYASVVAQSGGYLTLTDSTRYESFVQAAKEIAGEFSTYFLDLYTEFQINDPTSLAPDMLHPNDKGYRVLANVVLSFLGYSNKDFSALTKRFRMWETTGSAATAYGLSIITTQTSNLTRTSFNTNFYTKRVRYGYRSAATINTPTSIRNSGAGFSLNDGLDCKIAFGIGAYIAGAKGFVGLINSAGAISGTIEPNGITNCIGIYFNSTDTNWKIRSSDGANSQTVDLGVNFPSNTSSLDWFELYISISANTSFYKVIRFDSGGNKTIASGYFTNPPAAASLLHPQLWLCPTTAASVDLDAGMIQIQTNN